MSDRDAEGWVATTIRSMVAMLFGMAGFTFNDAFVKVVTETMPLGQAIFLRALVAFALLLMISRLFGRISINRDCLSRSVALRGAMEIAATVCFLTALMHMPIGPLIAILQAIPLAVTAGAAVFLGEMVEWRRWSAVLVGFVGVLIVIDPRAGEFNAWALLGVITVVFAATRDLATRSVARSVSSLTLMTITTVLIGATGLVMGLFEDWKTPDTGELARLLGAGVMVLVAYGGIVVSMRTGNVAAAAPMRYSAVLWGALVGYLVWGDIPDAAMIIGTVLIVASGVYAFWRERCLATRSLDRPRGDVT